VVRHWSPLVTAGLLPPNPPRAGPLGPRRESSGSIEPRASHMFAVTAPFEGVSTAPRVWQAAKRLRAGARGSTSLVRWSVGLDLPPQGLAITLWRGTKREPRWIDQHGASVLQCGRSVVAGGT